jgi:hypothetical protein
MTTSTIREEVKKLPRMEQLSLIQFIFPFDGEHRGCAHC